MVVLVADVHGLKRIKQWAALVPVHVHGTLHHVVAQQCADGDEVDVRHLEARGKLLVPRHDLVETVLAPIDEIHLVHANNDVLDLQQASDERVAAGLLNHTVACIDQNNRQVCRGGAGDHVARVLDVPGRVGYDELAIRRGEVTICHVDGDPLLPLGTQAVSQQREVHVLVASLFARLLNRLPLVLKNRLAVVQQSPDERALAIIHAPCGRKPQQIHVQVAFRVSAHRVV